MKKKEENRWIDVKNDEVMIKMGLIRYRDRIPRDPTVWTKSAKEKKRIKNIKGAYKDGDGHFGNIPIKHIKVWDKLIIQLKKNKHFPKTTYTFQCWQHEIPNILSQFVVGMDSLVHNYYFNKKSYKMK